MRVDARGRITIPKAMREQYGTDKGVEVELIPIEDGIRIQKLPSAKHPVDRLCGIIEMRHASSADEYMQGIRGE